MRRHGGQVSGVATHPRGLEIALFWIGRVVGFVIGFVAGFVVGIHGVLGTTDKPAQTPTD
jgi:hypothetical protein